MSLVRKFATVGGGHADEPRLRLRARDADGRRARHRAGRRRLLCRLPVSQHVPPAVRRGRLQRRLRAALRQGDRGGRRRRRASASPRKSSASCSRCCCCSPSSWNWRCRCSCATSSRRASPSDPDKLRLTVALATIMFPYLICMSLAAMMAGMLNSLRRYFAAAIAPVFLNVILIGVLVYGLVRGHDGRGGRLRCSPGACWRPASCSSPSSVRRRAPCRRVDRLSPAAPDAERQAPAVAGPAGRHHRRHHPDQPADRHGHRLGQGGRGARRCNLPTASTSCRSASSASPSASCCCRNWRAR